MTYGDTVNRVQATASAICALLALSAVASAAPAASAVPSDQPAVASRAAYPPELAAYYTQALDWSRCAQGLDCAWLTVPLDYATPAGPTIRLRISRVTASGPAAQRQGSLVVNPGGPGASGLDFPAYVAAAVAPKVATQFDIVGFDTRGVGQSIPVTCMTGRQTTTWLRADGSPDTAAEERRLMSLAARLAQGCLDRSPAIARHLGSDDTVRDMDILRQAIGDERLNFLGYSYGTFLGTLYAEAFPATVGRFVLDGALDPSLDIMEVSKGQSDGFQLAMTRFARDCVTRRSCPWTGSATTVLRGINAILAKVDRRPLPTESGRNLVQAEALGALFYTMYSPALWPTLRQALGQAKVGRRVRPAVHRRLRRGAHRPEHVRHEHGLRLPRDRLLGRAACPGHQRPAGRRRGLVPRCARARHGPGDVVGQRALRAVVRPLRTGAGPGEHHDDRAHPRRRARPTIRRRRTPGPRR